MHRLFVCVVCCLLAASMTCGCDRPAAAPGADASSESPGPTETSGVERIMAGTLKWDESKKQGRLDGLRLEVTAAAGWEIAPYDPNHVVSFTKGGALPQIVVDAEFSPLVDLDHVDEENLLQFTQAMKEELIQQGKKLKDDLVTSMVIGQRPCIRYDTGGRIGRGIVDRQVLVTHIHGRRYTVDLRTAIGQLDMHRDAAYAVLAGMTFRSADGEDSTETETEDSPTETEPATEDASTGEETNR